MKPYDASFVLHEREEGSRDRWKDDLIEKLKIRDQGFESFNWRIYETRAGISQLFLGKAISIKSQTRAQDIFSLAEQIDSSKEGMEKLLTLDIRKDYALITYLNKVSRIRMISKDPKKQNQLADYDWKMYGGVLHLALIYDSKKSDKLVIPEFSRAEEAFKELTNIS